MEYILYCDESANKGSKYGDFFGGCLIKSSDINEINNTLNNKKRELNLNNEIKWTKVTENYLDKYMQIIDIFFGYIKQGKIKVRIMFRHMNDLPSKNIHSNSDEKYFKLYYQFIKNAFGFRYITNINELIYIHIYLDQIPDTKGKRLKFKQYLYEMPYINDFAKSQIRIRKEDIAEICSHNHVILQCLDIILGSMNFKLNEFNRIKPEGKNKRGKRTVAKEKLYRHILHCIKDIIPNFNIEITTGRHGYKNPHWELPYSHWRFKPK